MARYYFDIHDGQNLTRDDVGIECSGPEVVKEEAMVALPAMARDTIPKDGDRQAMTVLVRNAKGQTVFTATLTFACIWLGEDTPSRSEDAEREGHMPLLWTR